MIVAGAADWLAPGGTLVVEIGETQGAAVLALAQAAGFTDARDRTGPRRPRPRPRRPPTLTACGRESRSGVWHRGRHGRSVASADVAVDLAQVDEIVAVLERGGVVVLPTDTVYGLAALPTSRRRVERLFALKGGRADVPLAVLCAIAEQALALAEPVAGVGGRRGAVLARARSRWCSRGAPGSSCTSASPSTPSGCGCPTTSWCAPSPRESGRSRPPAPTGTASRRPPTAAEAAASLDGEADLVVDGGRLDATRLHRGRRHHRAVDRAAARADRPRRSRSPTGIG